MPTKPSSVNPIDVVNQFKTKLKESLRQLEKVDVFSRLYDYKIILENLLSKFFK
jgi:hypothetical protein